AKQQPVEFLRSGESDPAWVGPVGQRCGQPVVLGRPRIDYPVQAAWADAAERSGGGGGRIGKVVMGEHAVHQVETAVEDVGQLTDVGLEVGGVVQTVACQARAAAATIPAARSTPTTSPVW